MPAEINLLPSKKIGFFTEERLLLLTKAAAVASVVLVISLAILFFLLSRDPTVSEQQADQARTLTALGLVQSKSAKYLIVIDRINKIKVIATQRSRFDEVMGTLVDQIPQNVVVAGFFMDKKTYSLSLSATDLSLIGTTIDNITTLIAQKKAVKTLTVQGLVTDEKSGKYVLSLSGDLL